MPFLPSSTRQQPANLLAVFVAGHAEVARRRALPDAVQQAGPKPAPLRIVLLDVEAAGAKLEDALEHLDRGAQALGAR